MTKRLVFPFLLFAFAFTTPSLQAMVIVPMTFEQLVHEASVVVYGRVAEVRGQWTSDRQSIDSVVTLDALHYLKGHLGPSVPLRLPGGTAGGKVQLIPGAPSVQQGELLVVFLKTQGPAVPTALGLGQGVFRTIRDARSGELMVTPPPLKESAIGRILRGAAERRTLTLQRFNAEVQQVIGR